MRVEEEPYIRKKWVLSFMHKNQGQNADMATQLNSFEISQFKAVIKNAHDIYSMYRGAYPSPTLFSLDKNQSFFFFNLLLTFVL